LDYPATSEPRPAPSSAQETVAGVFRLHTADRSGPHALPTWRVITQDAKVRSRIAEVLGHAAHGHGRGASDAEDGIITTSSTIDIILEGPHAISLRWYRSVLSSCDGSVRRERGDPEGRQCSCAPSLAERRKAVQHGRGCAPRVQFWFRLALDPGIGVFTLTSGNWSLTETAISAKVTLQMTNRPLCAQLRLLRTSVTLHSGRLVACTNPALWLLADEGRGCRTSGRPKISRKVRTEIDGRLPCSPLPWPPCQSPARTRARR
jgi:hypothetical protein